MIVQPPGFTALKAKLHSRQAYFACSLTNSAACQVAPESVETSTRVTSDSPAQVTPRTRMARERSFAPSPGAEISDFTFSPVNGCEFSSVIAAPAFRGSSGNRYPGFMKFPSNG